MNTYNFQKIGDQDVFFVLIQDTVITVSPTDWEGRRVTPVFLDTEPGFSVNLTVRVAGRGTPILPSTGKRWSLVRSGEYSGSYQLPDAAVGETQGILFALCQAGFHPAEKIFQAGEGE